MLKQAFRPEFLNRIDETIVFHPLGKEQLAQIVDVQLDHLRKRLATRSMKLDITEAAEKLLAEEGYDPTIRRSAAEARDPAADRETRWPSRILSRRVR